MWEALNYKILNLLASPHCTIRQLMSLIALLTATEKQVRFTCDPLSGTSNSTGTSQIHQKVIPIPSSLHPHLKWWLKEEKVLSGQPLHPLDYSLQIFTDTSQEGRATHLDSHIARGYWFVPESHLHMNFLELKAVSLARPCAKDE